METKNKTKLIILGLIGVVLTVVFVAFVKLALKTKPKPSVTVPQAVTGVKVPAVPDGEKPKINTLSQGYPWGHELDKIAKESVGEPVYLGDYLNRGFFSKPDKPQVVQASSTGGENITPGSEIKININVNNPEDYPLFDLQLFGVVNRVFGEEKKIDLVKEDEFLINPSFNLKSGESRSFEYTYKTKEALDPGNYFISIGFNEGRLFALGFLPFYNNSSVWFNSENKIYFSVVGETVEGLVLNKSSIKLKNRENELPFKTSESIISFPELSVSFDVLNNSAIARNLEVSYIPVSLGGEQFSEYIYDGWKDLSPKANVILEPQERRTIEQTLNLREVGNKLTEFEVNNNLNWANNSRSFSILKVTMQSEGFKKLFYFPMFLEYEGYIACPLYPSIDVFPIKKDQEFNLITGFLDYRRRMRWSKQMEDNTGKFEIILYDEGDTEIGKLAYDGVFGAERRGWKNTIKAPKDLNYIKMVGTIYDSNGRTNKKFERIYDCKEIGNCVEPSTTSDILSYRIYSSVLLFIVVVVFSLFTLIFLIKKIKK